MYRTVCLSALALVLAAAELPAQDSATAVLPGRLIRVRLTNGGGTQGTVVAIDSARLRLFITGADTLDLSRDEVTRVDVYQGMKSRVGQGALTGGLVGLAFGALLGAASASETEGSLIQYSAGEGAVAYGAAFGVLGAAVGALAGIHKRPTWKSASVPTVFVAPPVQGGGGVALGLHFTM